MRKNLFIRSGDMGENVIPTAYLTTFCKEFALMISETVKDRMLGKIVNL